MTQTAREAVPETPQDPAAAKTKSLTSWSTTRPELDAGPLMRAFVRVNVYLYSRPPSKVQMSINKFFLRMNVFLYRKSHGRILGRFGGLEALLITTQGRKSGKSRTVPLGYLYERGRFVVVAVPGHFDVPGGPRATHPNWFLNLRARPEAGINIGREQIEVTAEELSGDERERMWRGFTDVYPFIGEFQKRAGHLIPLVRLTPKDLYPETL